MSLAGIGRGMDTGRWPCSSLRMRPVGACSAPDAPQSGKGGGSDGRQGVGGSGRVCGVPSGRGGCAFGAGAATSGRVSLRQNIQQVFDFLTSLWYDRRDQTGCDRLRSYPVCVVLQGFPGLKKGTGQFSHLSGWESFVWLGVLWGRSHHFGDGIFEGRRDIVTAEYLLNREVEHILAALTPANRRVMRVCLATGLRVSDVLSLRPEQLKNRFWITEQKTKKKRMVGLKNVLIAELKAHSGAYWVFENRLDPKKHRCRQSVWTDVKRAARAFRMPQNASTHSARKIYAVNLAYKFGVSERVKRALNHDRMSTTLIYAMADQLLQAKYPRLFAPPS